MSRRKRNIIVSIQTASHTQRERLEAILDYTKTKSGDVWQLHLDSIGMSPQRMLDLSRWHGDGIIALVTEETIGRYLATGLPLVALTHDLTPKMKAIRRRNVSFIVNDHAEEGRTAARYFLDRRFTSFAYVSTANPTPWGRERGRGFAEVLAQAGFACNVCPEATVEEREDFVRELPKLIRWISDLPRGTAIFAAHDLRARQILLAADEAGLNVPNDFALLGVDNDAVICETASPALSSIPTDNRGDGVLAARLLEDMIVRGARGTIVTTRHTSVITRASTDIDAVTDPFVAQALDWARRHLAAKLDAETLAEKIHYSSQLLRIRAKNALGTTLAEEIRRIRLKTAVDLIVNSEKPIAEIAEACGFTGASHLGLRIREAYGKTPLELRRQS